MTAELLSPSAGPEFEGQTKAVFLHYKELEMSTNQVTGDKSRRQPLCLHVVLIICMWMLGLRVQTDQRTQWAHSAVKPSLS